ncbi:APC family permease, partial [Dietzia sp.]|uniref:APC family permease n=1 Tax=Dietzia sp. TaxID=1871616 RepID=UPI002FDA20BA
MSRFSVATRGGKRLVFGRPYRTDREGHTRLPKRLALPVFASDAVSSVAYAPEAIFLVLSLAGAAAIGFAPWVAVAVVLVLLVVVASYRQVIYAYPGGGGDYEVARRNLGPLPGQITGAALLIDYILTVSVSISAAVANLGSVVHVVSRYSVPIAVVAIILLAAVNLRGVRDSGRTFAIPVYFFIASVAVMIVWGLFRWAILGDEVRAESAELVFDSAATQQSGFALVFLVLRAFASGSAALTGIEAVGHGVPLFRKPTARNASRTLAIIGGLTAALFLGLIALSVITGVTLADDPGDLEGAPAGYHQKTLVVQLADAVFSGAPWMTGVIAAATGIILLLAANTAFNGSPVLASVLARDKYMPTQFGNRGDRLSYSNGIIGLAIAAIATTIVVQASVQTLIQLYVIGVFTSFTIGQWGMVVHWSREIAAAEVPRRRRRMRRARGINALGLVCTSIVLVIVVVTKFASGGWIVILIMAAVVVVMRAIHNHYTGMAARLRGWDGRPVLPSRIHCMVLVSNVTLPTLRTIAFARATRPDYLEAVTVSVDVAATKALVSAWEK